MRKLPQLFAPDTPRHVRRRRLIFLAVWLLAAAMVVWPLYPWLGARGTLAFGLPFSLVWVILALAIQFTALLWLYLGEKDLGKEDGETDHG